MKTHCKNDPCFLHNQLFNRGGVICTNSHCSPKYYDKFHGVEAQKAEEEYLASDAYKKSLEHGLNEVRRTWDEMLGTVWAEIKRFFHL